jgi:uncharacterized protein (TIGR00730 family)
MSNRRREPLPWQAPKPADDDPAAPARLAAIMANPSYLPADSDPGFLQRADMRGERLQLDYAKAEALLEAAGIEHTIVVFGSTRISEPARAARALAAARAAAAAAPGDALLARRVAVAARIAAKSHFYDMAREFGALVASCNADLQRCHTVVMTGGGPGIMEAANRGAFDSGMPNVGLNIDLPHEQYPNPYVTPGLCFRFHYFAMRKLHFMRRARALVAFPGGYGTLDEVFETLTLVQTRKMPPVPIVLVGREWWRRVLDLGFLVDEGVVDEEDAELFTMADSAGEAWEAIGSWYRERGQPLFDRTP